MADISLREQIKPSFDAQDAAVAAKSPAPSEREISLQGVQESLASKLAGFESEMDNVAREIKRHLAPQPRTMLESLKDHFTQRSKPLGGLIDLDSREYVAAAGGMGFLGRMDYPDEPQAMAEAERFLAEARALPEWQQLEKLCAKSAIDMKPELRLHVVNHDFGVTDQWFTYRVEMAVKLDTAFDASAPAVAAKPPKPGR